ncbi:uncharacterized protein [Lepeophtheirus salmonis]|uniref:uncharacterized protein n=1 Tax=Lepeophtheirus salmonis TaxID=72036 RepID=UPI003AF35592
MEGWISRFGVPDIIVSDRGMQFTSAIWTCDCRALRIANRTVISYHYESNELIERFRRSLKTGLVARIVEKKENWTNTLPVVLWGLRNTVVSMDQRSKYSHLQLLTGRSGSLASGFFDSFPIHKTDADVRRFFEKMEKVAYISLRVTQREMSDKCLCEADYVFVKNKPISESISPTFLDPFKIL